MPSLILRGLVAAALIATGWIVNGWRWSARMAAIEAEQANATTKASEEAREREQVLADAIAMIDATRTKERTKADEETARLRADVDAGRQRLLVHAACPAAGLPQAAAGPGLDRGTGTELDAAARPDYFALRAGLTRQETKLAACQSILAAERVAR